MDLHKEMWEEFNLSKILNEIILDRDSWTLDKRNKTMVSIFESDYIFKVNFYLTHVRIDFDKYDPKYSHVSTPLCRKNYPFYTYMYHKLKSLRRILKDHDYLERRRNIIENMPKAIVRDKRIDNLLN